MSNLFTITGANFDANESSGRKVLHGTISFTNPYTASGEVIAAAGTYFKSTFFGGNVTYIRQDVAGASAQGRAVLAKFRADALSFSAPILALFDIGLSGTAGAGGLVDCTTPNISGLTVGVQMWGI